MESEPEEITFYITLIMDELKDATIKELKTILAFIRG